jgi:hypothetical protein
MQIYSRIDNFTVVFWVCRHSLPDCAVVWKKVLMFHSFLVWVLMMILVEWSDIILFIVAVVDLCLCTVFMVS